jgi:hypothetical protein
VSMQTLAELEGRLTEMDRERQALQESMLSQAREMDEKLSLTNHKFQQELKAKEEAIARSDDLARELQDLQACTALHCICKTRTPWSDHGVTTRALCLCRPHCRIPRPN